MNEFAIQQNAAAAMPESGRVADPRLKEACKEFEGILLSMILKEGMKSAWRDESEAGVGSENMRDFAMEQAARALGRQGAFGLAESMLAQMAEQDGLR